jgi:hypothetical protein
MKTHKQMIDDIYPSYKDIALEKFLEEFHEFRMELPPHVQPSKHMYEKAIFELADTINLWYVLDRVDRSEAHKHKQLVQTMCDYLRISWDEAKQIGIIKHHTRQLFIDSYPTLIE